MYIGTLGSRQIYTLDRRRYTFFATSFVVNAGQGGLTAYVSFCFLIFIFKESNHRDCLLQRRDSSHRGVERPRLDSAVRIFLFLQNLITFRVPPRRVGPAAQFFPHFCTFELVATKREGISKNRISLVNLTFPGATVKLDENRPWEGWEIFAYLKALAYICESNFQNPYTLRYVNGRKLSAAYLANG